MKYIISVLLLIVLSSCVDRLDDNKRGFFKINTVDTQGSPISDMNVVVRSGFFYSDFLYSQAKFSDDPEQFILGEGITSEQGEASFLLLINSDRANSVDLVLNDLYLKRLLLDDDVFSNSLEYDMSTVILKPKSEVLIEFNNISGTTSGFTSTISYESVNCTQVLGTVNPPEFDCNVELTSGFNFDNGFNDSLQLLTIYPSIITVEYQEENGVVQSEQFTVTNPIENYVINF